MAELEPQSLTDAEILRAVEVTVVDVILPVIPEDEAWARAAAVQLAGLARYASRRGPDQTGARVEEIAGVLSALTTNPIVAAVWDGDRSQRSVMTAAGAALAAAVVRRDTAADEIRSVLRPVVVRQMDDELASTGPLVRAFRGQLDE